MLSKAEMEKMWQHGDIGALKSYIKNSRGKKLFKIELTPFRTEVMRFKDHRQTHEVWARNYETAIHEAKNLFYKNVNKELNYSSIEVKALP